MEQWKIGDEAWLVLKSDYSVVRCLITDIVDEKVWGTLDDNSYSGPIAVLDRIFRTKEGAEKRKELLESNMAYDAVLYLPA